MFDASEFDQALSKSGNVLKLFREALKHGKQNLHESFNNNEDIETLVYAYAFLIDELLSRVWNIHFNPSSDQSTLVAVGGYGRSELHPGSDIDLLLLFKEDSIETHKDSIEAFLTMLWDIGMEVGQSVRTVKECVSESKKDVTVITNLVESRFLAGERTLFNQMTEATAADKIWSNHDFFQAKWKEQQNRHLRFDDTAYKLEPNIKESPGGLRDIQTIGWIAKRHFGAKDLHELVSHHFLSEVEYQSLISGQRLLWKIRFALHILTKRREDRLLFDYQKTLALQFGFNDGEHNLAVEQFMQQYYRTVMELDRLNEILLQNFQEEIIYADDSSEPTPINCRFQIIKGFIEVTNNNVFKHYPYALLEIFLLLQTHPQAKGVRASTIRLIRSSQGLIDGKVRNDLRTRSLFMEILRQPHGITHELRRMNRYGILAAYLPQFANIVGRMQYDLFHAYTVDEHILFVVRNLRRFTVPEYQNEFPMCSEIIHKIAKPELLYLAGLLHDISKGQGGDHSELGEQVAVTICKDHGLGEYDTNLVAWLVKNHLIMSMTAQRKDINDPDIIQEFANNVGDTAHLDYLYLLTVADIRGTSPELWNSWKDSLLKELYHATKRTLRIGNEESISHKSIIKSKKTDALKILSSTEIAPEKSEKIWAEFNDDYFIQYTADEIAWHMQSIVNINTSSLPLVCVRYDKLRGSTAIFIYASIKSEQFAATTATLEKAGLDIVDARILSSKNNYSLDTYLVLDVHTEQKSSIKRLDEIKQLIKQALNEKSDYQGKIHRHPPRQHKHFDVKTEIRFSLDKNKQRTIVEITTADRPGLLSKIGEAFKTCEIELQNAKIVTIGMRIEDVFYITNKDNEPLTEEQFSALHDALKIQLTT
ncbi:MAG: [protein-PII] uridylyltransferase [Gammaproteobacteria bacterium]|nr:[protein-PII] uridylyltransferase [Gammaproteobacteria bacterium]